GGCEVHAARAARSATVARPLSGIGSGAQKERFPACNKTRVPHALPREAERPLQEPVSGQPNPPRFRSTTIANTSRRPLPCLMIPSSPITGDSNRGIATSAYRLARADGDSPAAFANTYALG